MKRVVVREPAEKHFKSPGRSVSDLCGCVLERLTCRDKCVLSSSTSTFRSSTPTGMDAGDSTGDSNSKNLVSRPSIHHNRFANIFQLLSKKSSSVLKWLHLELGHKNHIKIQIFYLQLLKGWTLPLQSVQKPKLFCKTIASLAVFSTKMRLFKMFSVILPPPTRTQNFCN